MTLRRILGFAAVAAFVALVGAVAYAWASGVRFYGVESDSMTPAFNRGDLVIDAPTTATTVYEVGEIITFHPTPGFTTTHRVFAVDASGVTTKGDANPTSDVGQIVRESIVGRVVAVVPFGGYVASFFQQPLAILALLVAIVAIYLLWQFADSGKPDTTTLSKRPEAADPLKPAETP